MGRYYSVGVGHEIFRLGSIAWETAPLVIQLISYYARKLKPIMFLVGSCDYYARSDLSDPLLPYAKFLDQPTLALVIMGCLVL